MERKGGPIDNALKVQKELRDMEKLGMLPDSAEAMRDMSVKIESGSTWTSPHAIKIMLLIRIATSNSCSEALQSKSHSATSRRQRDGLANFLTYGSSL